MEQAAVTQANDRQAGGLPYGACHGWTWPKASFGERVLQAAVAAVLLGALAAGLAMTPSPTGTGTHTVLGLPPCGMLVYTGRPCPTCGVTTSFALAAHGRFGEALVNQPFGLAVFALVCGGLLLAVVTLATGCSWITLVTVTRVLAAVIALTVLAIISWGYKWAQM